MGGPVGGTIRVRQDIWNLSAQDPWHPTILWYARAVRDLRSVTDVADPRGWPYLARIHGASEPQNQWPPDVEDWNSCQHGSWFFLPWHRMYLHYFERILLDYIVAEGGPADWALPFWDYSTDPDRSETLALPPAFISTDWPDGGDNPLRVEERADGINDGDPLDAADVEPTGWTVAFSTDFLARPSFGGPVTAWHHGPEGMGALERQPHGIVHVRVGGVDQFGTPGFMSDFPTAPLDPIFWLHHCNIDRLWEVWRNFDRTELPTVTPWLDFSFAFGTGSSRVELRVADVQHTAPAPLGYSYEGVPIPPVPELERGEEEEMGRERPPELVGASDEVRVGSGPARARVPVAAGDEERSGGGAGRTIVTIENVTGASLAAGVYVVAVGVPADADPLDYPDRQVGRFSTFGLAEATRGDEEHPGGGLTFSFDVTELVSRLEATGDWDPENVEVAIGPSKPVPGAVDEISVGRVGVYRE